MTSLARTIGRSIIDNSKSQGRPMDTGEGHMLLSIMMFNGDVQELHESMQESFIYKILDARIAHMFKGEISPLAKTFATQLAGGNPGNAVLLAAVLCELSEGGTRPVEIGHMVDAFPFNVPTEQVLHTAWDSQKGMTHDGVYHDNALDALWAWQDEQA